MPGVVDVVTGAEVDLPPVPGMANRAMARPLLAATASASSASRWPSCSPRPPSRARTPRSGWWSTTSRCLRSSTRSTALASEAILFPELGHEPGQRASATRAAADVPGRVCEAATSWSASASSTSGWRPGPLEGAVVRGRLGRRPARACGARPRTPTGCARRWRSTYGLDEDRRAGRRPRRRRRFRRQDRRPPRGRRARLAGPPVRAPGAVDRDPHREHDRHGPRPRAGARGRDRRPPRRHHRGLPPRRSSRTPAPTRRWPPSCRYLTRSMAAGTYAIPAVDVPRPRGGHDHHAGRARTAAPGRPEATAAIERAVDLFAAEVGLDPAEVRRRNLLPRVRRGRTPRRPARPTTAATTPGRSTGCLAAAGYDDLRAEQARRRAAGDHRALGIGLSCYVEVTTGPRAGREFARVEVRAARGRRRRRRRRGGRHHRRVAPRPGARHRAGHAGGRRDRPARSTAVRVVHGDTDVVARGTGTFGSRSLQLGGSAVRERRPSRSSTRPAGGPPTCWRPPVDDVVLDPAPGAFHVVGSPAVAALGRRWRRRRAGPTSRRRCRRARRRPRLHHRPRRPTRSAPTWPSSRSTPRPATCGCCAWWRATTPAGSSTRCWPTASATAGWPRAPPRRCTRRSPSTPTATR